MKHRCLLIVVVLVFSWNVGTGLAVKPEDLLKEKGILTQEEYEKVIENEAKLSYKLGKGFTLEARDGRFLTSLGSLLQFRYTFENSENGDDESDFDIRRARFYLRGHVFNPRLEYKFQLEAADDVDLLDYEVKYEFLESLAVRIGQFVPPQSRQEITSSGKQLFADRSLANDTFNLGRDRGIEAQGVLFQKVFEYRLGIFNGNGLNEANRGNNHMVSGRASISPVGEYSYDEVHFGDDQSLTTTLGGSLSWNHLEKEDVGNVSRDNDSLDVFLNLDALADEAAFISRFGRDLDLWVGTVDAGLRWRVLSLAAEYYFAKANPDLGRDVKGDGYYVQGAYFPLPQRLQLAGRFSRIDPNKDISSNDIYQAQFGTNFFFLKHNLKLTGDYTFEKDDGLPRRQDETHTIRLQLQIIL